MPEPLCDDGPQGIVGYLNTTTAGARINRTSFTVLRLIYKGVLPGVRLDGRTWLVKTDDVDAYLATRGRK